MNTEQKYLINERYTFRDLIDADMLREMFEHFSQATELAAELVILPDNEWLVRTGWSEICTEFCMTNPESEECCQHNIPFSINPDRQEETVIGQCTNGLMNGIIPVVIKDVHVANLVAGQIFFSESDKEKFNNRGESLDCNVKTYPEALSRVPVLTEKKLREALIFLKNMIVLMAEKGLNVHQNNKVMGIPGVTGFMSKHKQTELISLTERQRLETIIEGTNVGTWDWNIQTGETVFNEKWAAIIGYSLEEIAPVSIETWTKMVHPLDRKKSEELLEKHFSGELDYYDCEVRMKHKNGSWIWILDRGKVYEWDGEGKPLKMSGTHQDITSRKESELLLQEKTREIEENKIRLELAIEAGEHGFWDWNLVTNETYFSPSYYTMLGYADKELPMSLDTFVQLIHEDDAATVMPVVQKSIESGNPYEVEFRLKCKNGSYKWIMGKGKSYRADESGKPNRAVGVHINIDEQKKAAEELKRAKETAERNEERFNLAMKAANDGIFDWNLETDEIYYSPGWKKMLGYEEHEIPDDFSVWEKTTKPEDVKRSWELQQKLITKQIDRFVIEFKMRHKAGHWVDILSRAEAVFNEKGKAVRMIGTHTDITEQKKNILALQENRQLLQSMLEAIPDMVSIHDKDMTILYSNWNGFGTVPKEKQIIGSKCYYTYRGYDSICPDCQAKKVLKTNKAFQTEALLPDGRWVDLRVIPIQGLQGETSLFLEWVRDITEKKQAEEVIRESGKLLEAKNSELQQLVYVASHDLRSPLVNVDGFSRELEYSLKELSDLMESGKNEKALEKALRKEFPDMEKSISRIRASTAQMDGLLKGLLKLSRVGRAALQIETLDMNRLLDKLIPSFAYRIRESGIKMEIKQLPDCRADAGQVVQIFANLIDNAIKYLDSNRPGIITISGSTEDMLTLYRVEDNGTGISENHQDRIFELFYRLKPRETEGEGIGLTMVRQILLRMGGGISVKSKPGEGSVFIVALPKAREIIS
jgi:PAS domain S-box-containing protein